MEFKGLGHLAFRELHALGGGSLQRVVEVIDGDVWIDRVEAGFRASPQFGGVPTVRSMEFLGVDLSAHLGIKA